MTDGGSTEGSCPWWASGRTERRLVDCVETSAGDRGARPGIDLPALTPAAFVFALRCLSHNFFDLAHSP